MCTLKTTNLQHASAASPAIVLASDGTATAQLSSLNGGALSGARNRIINGDMRIDQRNAGASVTPTSSVYGLDRWYNVISQSSKYSLQRSTVAPAGFTNSMLATSLSAYSVGTSDFFALVQYVEGFNASDLGWGAAGAQTVTLSFRVRSSLTGTFVVAIRSGSDDAAYPATYTINSANTWETKTITIPGPTSGTFATDNNRCFGVWFSLGIGSSFNATANTWGSGSALSVSGATSVVGTNGATFYITGVQLEAGSVATPFERRSYGQELALCQRYYEVGTSGFTGYATAGIGVGAHVAFAATKRATPTIALTPFSYTNASGASTSNIAVSGFIPYGTTSANGGVIVYNNWTADAEL
jgi:hypothetical protein